jgi:hypothetical protein
MGGLGIFIVAILLAEGLLWPAERRLQVAVSAYVSESGSETEAESGADGGADSGAGPNVLHDAQLVIWSATAALVLLIVGAAIMVSQP